ncbi:MAG: FeoB-associated Cys-rich membrane protein [Methylophilaceae bacterium]|nr:FeoB-associated Cys-rich membrane protein [Methylophilaceae bacterium]
MCILMNVALVLSIAALIKYLIKGKCGCGCNCGCSCCNGKKESCGTESNSCCK